MTESTRDLYDEIATLRQELATSEAACASAMAEVEALSTAVRHVVDCYRHGNLMGVIVGVDKLAGMVSS